MIVALLALLYPWSWFVNQWFAERELYRPLLELSSGLLYPPLQVCAPTLAVLWLAFRLGGLRPPDVGWRRSNLAFGLAATVALWLIVNLLALIGHRGGFAWHSDWTSSWQLSTGRALGQLLGNALFEETIYRGFFLTQFLRILRARGHCARRSAWLAALASAVVFAVPHIPNRFMKDRYDGIGIEMLLDQLRLVASGLFASWVYLRTGNLWWTVGLHSLANYPALVVAWSLQPAGEREVTVLVGTILTAAWPRVVGGGAGSPPRSPGGRKRFASISRAHPAPSPMATPHRLRASA